MEHKKRQQVGAGVVSPPAIFRIGNYSDKSIKLFSGPLEEHQVVRAIIVGGDTYDSYTSVLRKIGLIRVQFGNYKNLSVTFSRKINDKVVSKTIPLRLLLKANQFMPDIVMIEPNELILDGDTTIEINGVEHHPIEMYFYPVKSETQNGDEKFLDFINDQYKSFYDYVEFKNNTLDSQKFSIYFTENGVTVDNPNVQVVTNKFPYKVGERVHLLTAICDNKDQIDESIYIGEDVNAYKSGSIPLSTKTSKDYLFPISQLMQVITTIRGGLDPEGRIISDFKVPAYSYMLRAQEKIQFSIFKSTEIADVENIMNSTTLNQTVTILGTGGVPDKVEIRTMDGMAQKITVVGSEHNKSEVKDTEQ